MKQISIFALSLIILLSACKKDPVEVPVEPGKRLVGLSYENSGDAPASIKYDDQGRVIEYKDDEDLSTFIYKGNEVSIKEWRINENREVFNFKGYLNEKGQLYTGTAVSEYNLNNIEQVVYTFEYDASGYMVRKTRNANQGASVFVYEYSYAHGDMTEYKVYFNGAFNYGGAWEYDLSKQDKSNLNWEQFNGPNKFTGKTNQHLPIKYTGNTGWFANMVYTFDNQGYPTSNTLTYDDGDVIKVLYHFE